MAGFLEGRVKVPGVGEVPKALAYGGVAVVGVLAIVYFRNRKSASASSATPATTAAGTASSGPYPPDGTTGNPSDLYSTDPATGQTYGNEQYAASSSGALYGSSGYGGSVDPYPWDGTSGNPSDPYSMDPTTGQTYGDEGSTGGSTVANNNGPPFTSNAAWSQYAQNYLVNTVGLAAGTVSQALGDYLAGNALTAAEQSIINQAIAFALNPPVQGPGGYPPAIKVQANTGGGSGPQTAVPNVVGQALSAAESALQAAGFTYQVTGATSGTVTGQSPAGGTAASAGTLVTLTVGTQSGPVVTPSGPPNVVGMTLSAATAAIQSAGWVVNSVALQGQAGQRFEQGVNPAQYASHTVVAATPHQAGKAGSYFAKSVDLIVS